MSRVAIVGSRTWSKPWIVENYIYNLPVGSVIISGGADGVDYYAVEAAKKHKFEYVEHLADWTTHGKAAGPIRNQLIVDDCDYMVAFHNGWSKGTKNSIELAVKSKRQVFVFLEDGSSIIFNIPKQLSLDVSS